jgi:DNA-binding NarL/FixJ family response regulator
MSLVLCDDHGMFLDALSMALTARGHRVLATSHDPDEVVRLVRETRPRGCVLDVSFGGRPRIEAAGAVRAVRPETAVLLLTGADTPDVWGAFQDRLVDGVVSKGCDVEVLDRSIRRVLDGERVLEGWSRIPDPPARTDDGIEELTDREREILRLIVKGVSTQMMADSLGVSSNTVRTHVQNVLRKLRVHHRSKAARYAVESGLV